MGLWLVGSAVLMTNNNNRPTGFYIKYLEALNAKPRPWAYHPRQIFTTNPIGNSGATSMA